MMKTLITILATFLLWPLAVPQQSDREQSQLHGPVKSVDVYLVDFQIKDGRTEESKRKPSRSTTFNPEGNVTERIDYDYLGNVVAKYFYTYDHEGRSTGYEEYPASLDKALTVVRRHVYVLDESGRRIEYKVYDSEGKQGSRFTYKYDARGNNIEEAFYYHTGQLGGRIVRTYDERGNQSSQISYNADGAVTWKTVSIFDAAGNLTERLQYQGDKLKYKVLSRYDDKGRIAEVETQEFNAIPNVHVSHAPQPGKVIYTYDDEKMTKTAATYKQDGSLKERVLYTYDSKGTELERTTLKADGAQSDLVVNFYDNIYEPGSKLRGSLSGKSSVEIVYDSHGNWTKKTYLIQTSKAEKPQPYRAEVRVITYH